MERRKQNYIRGQIFVRTEIIYPTVGMGKSGPFTCSEGRKFLVLLPLKLVKHGEPGLNT